MLDAEIEALNPLATSEPLEERKSGDFSPLKERLETLSEVQTLECLREAVKALAESILASEDECALLFLAVLCSEVYLQSNWTGPEVTCDIPFHPNTPADVDTDLCKAARDDLTSDGEEVYERVRGCMYLWLAVELMKYVENCRSAIIWRGRIAFMWQRSLADSNDHGAGHSAALLRRSLDDLVDVDFTWLPDETQASIKLEIAQRMTWYNRTKRFDEFIEEVCRLLQFSFVLTGEEGIKRKYQTLKFAQLVVKTDTRLEENAQKTITFDETKPANAPQNKTLLEYDDMTDILEVPKFDREEDEALGALQQCILLAQCHYLWTTNAVTDEMMLTEIGAMAQRILIMQKQEIDGMWTSNWLVFSCGLWFRCKTEYHRNKTRERATFQLQALVDQFDDKDTTGAHRMRYAYQTNYPPRHHLQWELGMRMMKMGMVLTAFEHFEKLKMWPEAVDCLMVAGRKQQAIDLIRSLLNDQETPRLWCCLGDLEGDIAHYQKAWDLSSKRSGRAQRSLGHHYYKKGEMEKAVEHYGIAVLINTLHTNIWFNMGCAQMRLSRFLDAIVSFQRCCNVGGEDADAWGNLAACFVECQRYGDAAKAIEQAVKYARGDFRVWESFLSIHLRLRDIAGCIKALSALVMTCDRAMKIDMDVVGLLISECPVDKVLTPQLVRFCETLTAKRSDALTWRYYAQISEKAEAWSDVWRCRLNELRCIQARMWDVEVTEFLHLLSALVENNTALSTLCEAGREGDGLAGLSMSLKNCCKKLKIRMDQSGLNMNEDAVRFQDEVQRVQEYLDRIIQERNKIEEE